MLVLTPACKPYEVTYGHTDGRRWANHFKNLEDDPWEVTWIKIMPPDFWRGMWNKRKKAFCKRKGVISIKQELTNKLNAWLDSIDEDDVFFFYSGHGNYFIEGLVLHMCGHHKKPKGDKYWNYGTGLAFERFKRIICRRTGGMKLFFMNCCQHWYKGFHNKTDVLELGTKEELAIFSELHAQPGDTKNYWKRELWDPMSDPFTENENCQVFYTTDIGSVAYWESG